MLKPVVATIGLAALALLVNPAQAVVVSATNNTFGAVDESSDTRSFNFSAGDFTGTDGIIDQVTIELSFAKCTDQVDAGGCFGADDTGEDPFTEEIEFILESPNSTSVVLVRDQDPGPETFLSNGDEGNISVVVLFDDGGAALPGDVPVDGTFAPQELLASFIGENPVGTWTLTFSDDTDEDPLGLFSATLNITVTETGNPGTGVPEPATLALFGAGILGLGWARRRRKAV